MSATLPHRQARIGRKTNHDAFEESGTECTRAVLQFVEQSPQGWTILIRGLGRTAVGHLRRHLIGILVGLWILSVGVLAAVRIGDIPELFGVGMLLAMGYIFALIWWFVREMGSVRPNDVAPLISRPRSFIPMLGVVLVAVGVVVVVTAGVFRDGWLMVWVSTVPALLAVAWFRDQITRRTVIVAVGVAAVLFVLGLVHQPPVSAVVSALVMGVHLIAGVVLLQYTGVGMVQTIDGEYAAALRGLAQGVVLAVPPTLLNLAAAEGAEIIEITDPAGHWWLPVLAAQPALSEEIWARLFLVTLFVAVLYPVSRDRPRRAVVAALGLAVVVHVLAHVPHTLTEPSNAIFMSLFYGVPLVMLFVARDLEHAIGYHFFINFVIFVVAPPF